MKEKQVLNVKYRLKKIPNKKNSDDKLKKVQLISFIVIVQNSLETLCTKHLFTKKTEVLFLCLQDKSFH